MEFVWLAVYSDQNSVHILYSIYIFSMKYTSNANACMYASASEQRNNSDRKQQKTISEKKSSTFHGNGIIFKENLKISDFILKNYFVTTAIVD